MIALHSRQCAVKFTFSNRCRRQILKRNACHLSDTFRIQQCNEAIPIIGLWNSPVTVPVCDVPYQLHAWTHSTCVKAASHCAAQEGLVHSAPLLYSWIFCLMWESLFFKYSHRSLFSKYVGSYMQNSYKSCNMKTYTLPNEWDLSMLLTFYAISSSQKV